MLRIGLFSEDRALQPLLSSALGKSFQLTLAADEAAFERSVESGLADVLLVDLNEGHRSAAMKASCCTRLLAADPSVLMVIMADDSLRSTAAELVRLGAFGYLRRPPSVRDLKTMLLRAHETQSLKRKQQPPPQPQVAASCDRLTGSSPRMQQMYDLIRRVAGIHASVLVTGESGSGKELIASAIHNLGNRSREPFIAVSCGAIP
jgi:DNA-binding NtrC family response regulator